MTVREYYQTVDQEFGIHDHQRRFLTRMERLQELHPCSLDHEHDTPPCHVSRCYPRSGVDALLREEKYS